MGEILLPCPFCGETIIGVQHIAMGVQPRFGWHVVCSNCGAMADDVRDWNRRTSGPATVAMLHAARQHRPYLDSRDEVVVVITATAAQAFLAEHEPAKEGP